MRLNHNPYQGINAHFQSYLLAQGNGWVSFHNNHITYLTNEINRHLPEGYYAVSEVSLQVQALVGGDDFSIRPDVGIFQADLAAKASGTQSATLEKPTFELIPMVEDLGAIEIYEISGGKKLVTRLEVLSPTNKRQAQTYLKTRHALLRMGVHMVELDYIHELPPLFSDLPVFSYWITVSDSSTGGQTRFYGFGVDDPIPALTLPLSEGTSLMIDFNAPYQAQFAEDRRAHMELDYAELPHNFSRYSPNDQERIRLVMKRIQESLRA